MGIQDYGLKTAGLNVWRINTRQQTLDISPTPDAWFHLGGRGLIARALLDEIDPKCDPLGPGNKLVFAPGLMVGHMLSSCDRISVGAKSPLTLGIKESNAGGSTGLQLTLLGIKALILEGQPEAPGWWCLHLSKAGARFEDATDLLGQGVYECAIRLRERFGNKVAIALIGPGGESLMTAAGIQNLDKDKVPSRINARGGLGAVMGSKRIKAIIIDASEGEKPSIADYPRWKQAQKEFNKSLLAHPQTAIYRDFGTAAMARMCDGFGGLPTRNFSAGHFEDVEKISGEMLREQLLRRGGDSETTHACMLGCTIRCSNIFGGEDGKAIVSPLEYETIGLMGPNLAINDFDIISRMNWQVNDLGLDTIEIGAALGVAAEAGVFEFGNGTRALSLLDEIRQGTPLGFALGNGAAAAGEYFGVSRVPVVKRQAMSAYEPRAIKGTGVTYATSPQGADHTCGLTIRMKIDHLDPKGQADASRTVQINNAGYDTLGACSFAGFGFAAAPETICELLNARYGWQVEKDVLQVLGRECLKLEREFNRLAGFTKADDRLPDWMSREQLPPHNSVFDVPEEDLDGVFNW